MTTFDLPLHVVNLLAYIVNAVFTYGIGAGGGWFGNLPDNATLSHKYQTILTPAGWAFGIWGIIFTAQLVWTLFQQHPRYRTADAVQAVNLNYLWVCLAQVAWTVSFSFEILPLSLAFMLLILYFLAIISKDLQPMNVHYLWKFPFYIHFGWICAATIVNLNVVLVWLRTPAMLQFIVGLISLVFLFVVAAWTQKFDYTVPAVLGWALLGVYSELNSTNIKMLSYFTVNEIKIVRISSMIGAVLIAVALTVKGYFQWKHSTSVEAVDVTGEATSFLRMNN